MAPRGLFRERNGEGSPGTVLVQFEKDRFDVPEVSDRELGYEPPFGELLGNSDYAEPARTSLHRNASHAPGTSDSGRCRGPD